MDVLNRYVAGYFPLYDPWGRFYWERLGVRAVLTVDEETIAKARKLGARGRKRFEIRYNTALAEIIAHLQDERVKENSWVKREVVQIYHLLDDAGMLRTLEAWRGEKLVGTVLGIVLPGTFIAETMFGLVPEASKVCLCRLVADCAGAGFEMIDVQTPHNRDAWGEEPVGTPHPCMRLGEKHLRLTAFMHAFSQAWHKAFKGGPVEWLAASRSIKLGLTKSPGLGRALQLLLPPASTSS